MTDGPSSAFRRAARLLHFAGADPIDLAFYVLGLALVDSINPSALAVTLWWLAQPAAAPRVLA
ncbi:MAG: hypothetical protein ABWX88_08920, partial [Pseudoxanthomonas sp.]